MSEVSHSHWTYGRGQTQWTWGEVGRFVLKVELTGLFDVLDMEGQGARFQGQLPDFVA